MKINVLSLQRQKLSETENEWRGVIRDSFVRNLSTLKSQSTASHSAITMYPYLTVLDVSAAAIIAIPHKYTRELIDLMNTKLFGYRIDKIWSKRS